MAYQQNDFGGNALDNYLTGKVARREFCVAWHSSAEARWWVPPCWAALPASLRRRLLPPPLFPLLCQNQNHG